LLDFIDSSWCSDYGNAAKTYDEIKGSSSIFGAIAKLYLTNITNNGKIYYNGKVKIKFKTTATLSGEKLTVNNREISLIASRIEIDGLRAIITNIDSLVGDTLTLSYAMVDVAQDNIANVILTKIKFDFFLNFSIIINFTIVSNIS
jgi:hypothetical protein